MMMWTCIFTLPNCNNIWIYTMFVLICEIAEHILINLLDHNVELQTSLQYFSNFANKNKHCVNSNVVTIWKCKYASSHHHNLMINSSLILRSSIFTWFSKWYVQQFGDLKVKNKWTTWMRAIIIKQYYHYKFNLELNI